MTNQIRSEIKRLAKDGWNPEQITDEINRKLDPNCTGTLPIGAESVTQSQVLAEMTDALKTSDYTQEHLSKRSVETFLAIAGGYPKGHCRMNGTCSWFIRVSNHSVSLVTTYQTKGDDGQWSGPNEWSEAL